MLNKILDIAVYEEHWTQRSYFSGFTSKITFKTIYIWFCHNDYKNNSLKYFYIDLIYFYKHVFADTDNVNLK